MMARAQNREILGYHTICSLELSRRPHWAGVCPGGYATFCRTPPLGGFPWWRAQRSHSQADSPAHAPVRTPLSPHPCAATAPGTPLAPGARSARWLPPLLCARPHRPPRFPPSRGAPSAPTPGPPCSTASPPRLRNGSPRAQPYHALLGDRGTLLAEGQSWPLSYPIWPCHPFATP
jgi:hypothetical protein